MRSLHVATHAMHAVLMSFASVASIALALGCGGGPSAVPPALGDCDVPTTTLPPGDASGGFCGNITAEGSLTVPAGATFTLEPGAVLEMPGGASISVAGAFSIAGTEQFPVEIVALTGWNGIDVSGDFSATFARINGEFGAIFQSGGTVAMSDVKLDMFQPVTGPDCVTAVGGTMTLDHVHLTGCHCPMHIDATTSVSATASILDGATNPLMMGGGDAEIHGNHMLGVGAPLYDLGGNGVVNVEGNYYGGGAPGISGDPARFINNDDFVTSEIEGVGPRF